MRIRDVRRQARPTRGRVGLAAVGAMVASLFAVAGGAPAQATQATGHDVPIWQNGWSWTYATTFNYDDGNGTKATINENVTYTNAGPTTFQGQDAYKVTMSGNITGGSGKVTGSVNACQLPARSAVFDSAALACANLSRSKPSRAKARTTRTPESWSRSTRLMPSIRPCMLRNIGSTCEKIQ